MPSRSWEFGVSGEIKDIYSKVFNILGCQKPILPTPGIFDDSHLHLHYNI